MSKSEYEQVYDGKWFELPDFWLLACCDCGLVHDVYVRNVGGKLLIRFDRNSRATGGRRRAMKKAANDDK